MSKRPIAYSVIIPVKDEFDSLSILHQELTGVLARLKKPYEILFINDGSTDASEIKLRHLRKIDAHVHVISFRANFGKSAALWVGFSLARGNRIITLDADLQDDPKDIPALLSTLGNEYDLVCGWRQKRTDTVVKRLSSLLFNKGTAIFTGVKLHDVNCGLKAFRTDAARDLYVHGELHRFIPILVAKRKYRVAEIPVHNRARRFGASKYGLGRSWRGIIDLLTTIVLTDYASKPAHFFGKIGLLFFLAGFVMDAYVSFLRLTTGSTQGRIPLLLAGILFIMLGVQLLSTGLIAEMIIYHGPKQYPPYTIIE